MRPDGANINMDGNGGGSARDRAAPFQMGPPEAAGGVLLVHGFTGTPFEMSLLGRALAQVGLAVEGPLLAGHGAEPEQLAATGWPDWLASVDEALTALRRRAPRVAVCGLSLGGLLTLELARRRPDDLSAIAVLAAPLWLSPWAERGIRLMTRLRWLRLARIPKLSGSDIADTVMRRDNPSAAAMPMSSLLSLLDLMEHLRPHLEEVRAPALLAHSRRDHTAPFASMEAIARGLEAGGTPVKQLVLERSFHVITLDLEREVLFRAVTGHVLTYLRPNS